MKFSDMGFGTATRFYAVLSRTGTMLRTNTPLDGVNGEIQRCILMLAPKTTAGVRYHLPNRRVPGRNASAT